MLNKGRHFILTNYIQACDYNYVLFRIMQSIEKKKNFLISPIASQTLVIAWLNKELKDLLYKFDLLVPDSQWVKRALYFLYGVKIRERVYGPELMKKVCSFSKREKYLIGLYGASRETVTKLKKNIENQYPGIEIKLSAPSLFKEITQKEKICLVKQLFKKKIQILFVGLGSPLQEVFSFEIIETGKKIFGDNFSLVCIPVGAAFDLLSFTKKQAPKWMQETGLEWLFRLYQEPKRLWKRYLVYSFIFIILLIYWKILLLNFSNNKTFKKGIICSKGGRSI